jgi:hypothetical protein
MPFTISGSHGQGEWRLHSSANGEMILIANAPGPLLSGAVRRTQFPPRSPPLRHLATLADHRHQGAGAGAGRSAVSARAYGRLDKARASGASLPGQNCAQRGSRPRGCTDCNAAPASARSGLSTASAYRAAAQTCAQMARAAAQPTQKETLKKARETRSRFQK